MRFKRFSAFNTINANNLSATNGATYYALDQVPGYAEFTALFDQYRITKVIHRFFPISKAFTQTNVASGGAINVPPRFITAVDFDDSTTAAFNDLRQYSTAEVVSCQTPVTRVIKPCVSTVVYESVGSSGYAPKSDVWISTNDPTVPHYGIKWSIGQNTASGADNVFGYVPEVEFHLEFRLSK